tara:strand:+ start:1548 stop:8054 length:6507 start_codon:yes stop_codon:yes gene_type:complete
MNINNQEIFVPGHILINSNTQQTYGVLVKNLPSKKIVFRLDKNTFPVFSKIDNHPYIQKIGNINESSNSDLKSALLKYYSTNNLTESEKKILVELLNFSFPNGIPKYQPDIELPDEDILNMDLGSKLVIGNKLYLNTNKDSSYKYLNNKSVYIVDKNSDGMWVNLPSDSNDENSNNSYYFLFYKNQEIPTFSGITRILPLTEKCKYIDKYIEKYKNLNSDNQLSTTLQYNGEIIKVDPVNKKVIFPTRYQDLVYDIYLDTCKKDNQYYSQDDKLDNVNVDIANNNVIDHTSNPNILIGGGSKDSENKDIMELKILEDELDKSIESDYFRQNKQDEDFDLKNVDNDSELLEILKDSNNEQENKLENNDIDTEDKNNIEDKDNKEKDTDRDSDTDKDSDSDFEIEDVNIDEMDIIDEEEIEEEGTIQKVKRVEVAEIDKIYKESVQVGDLLKFKIEQIPKLKRNNEVIINNLKKNINNITLLKNKLSDNNDLKFDTDNNKGLFEKFINNDFTNKFYLPIIRNKKNIYLTDKTINTLNDYNKQSANVIENFNLNLIEQRDKLNNYKVNSDILSNNVLSDLNPNKDYEYNSGIYLKLGNNIELTNKNVNKFNQDTLTVKLTDSSYTCQSFSLQINDIETQVSLGPYGRCLTEDELNLKDNEDQNNVYYKNKVLYVPEESKILYSGDLLNIIGIFRPPLSYFNKLYFNKNNDNMDNINIHNLFKKCQNSDNIVHITLGDYELLKEKQDDDTDYKFNLLQHPDKLIILKFPENYTRDEINEEFKLILPSIEDILKHYDSNIKSIYDIVYILDLFNINIYDITIDSFNIIDTYIKRHYEKILKFDKKLNKLVDNQKSKGNSVKSEKINFKLIDDNLIEELNKYYLNQYIIDSNTDIEYNRLRHVLLQNDNGDFFFTNILLNKLIEEKNNTNIDSLNEKLSNLEESLIRVKDNRPVDVTTQSMANKIDKCNIRKSNKPNILKYPNEDRLLEDNLKIIADTDGEMVKSGDYAITKDNNNLLLYKRVSLNEGDVWIKEDISTLNKLISDSKEHCDTVDNLNLDNNDVCLFDTNNFICNPLDLIKIDKNIENINNEIEDLKQDIEYVKSLPKIISELTNKINNIKSSLLNYTDIQNKLNDEIIKEEIKLNEEYGKSNNINKCIHNKVVDYFNKIPNINLTLDDNYAFCETIFEKFLNTDIKYNYINLDRDNDNNNWTKCNVCNNNLLCQHYLLGVSYLKNNKPIDIDKIISIYGVEDTGSIYCKVCGDIIDTVKGEDIDEFVKGGKEGARFKTKEIVEETTYYEHQKQLLDNKINDMLDNNDINKSQDLEVKIEIINLIKSFCGIDELLIDDEIELLNFIEYYNFLTKKDIVNSIVKKYGTKISKTEIFKQVNKLYLFYIISDIISRFLIIIQTSQKNYTIKNNLININYIGYPIINDKKLLGGINLLVTFLNHITVLPKYKQLKDIKFENKIIERLTFQVENDPYVKQKIYNSISVKNNHIDNLENYYKSFSTKWNSFKPMLNVSVFNLEKIISDDILNEINHKNYDKIYYVSIENVIYNVNKLMMTINNIIKKEEPLTLLTLSSYMGNSCCIEDVSSSYQYYSYFNKEYKDINYLISKLDSLFDIISKLKNKKISSLMKIIVSNNFQNNVIVPFDVNIKEDDINLLKLKYISSGINQGHEYIFNKYGKCILSNNYLNEISKSSFTNENFYELLRIIQNKNSKQIKKRDKINDNINELEFIYLDNLINLIPDEPYYNFIINYLESIKTKWFYIKYDDIKQKYDPNKENTKKQKDKLLDIYKHIDLLNSQINIEINFLLESLNFDDKKNTLYDKLINLGDYVNLKNEYESNLINDNKENYEIKTKKFREKKKETSIKKNVMYLNNIINQIKNKKLLNIIDKKEIRPQFRLFFKYKDSYNSFNKVYTNIKPIITIIKYMISKENNNIFTEELVSLLCHYFILLLINKILNTFKNTSDDNNEKIDLDIQLDNIEIKDLDEGMEYNQDKEKEINIINDIKFKKSKDLNIMSNFIIDFINKINKTQQDYDQLTQDRIDTVLIKHQQKQIERNLKSLAWLSKQGKEDEYNKVLRLMAIGKLGYKDLSTYMGAAYGDEIFHENDRQYVDNENYPKQQGNEIQHDDDIEQNNDILGLSNHEREQLGFVADPDDDMEDQDYGFMQLD